MHYETIQFSENSQATLTLYMHEQQEGVDIKRRPVMLVVPGGGYSHLSFREGEPIALAYHNKGYHAAVLSYSIREDGDEPLGLQPIEEGILAIKWLKAHASRFHIIDHQYFVVGFSAGGHLAAGLGTLWNEPYLMQRLGYEDDRYKPDGMILSYPVLSSGPHAHRGSFTQLSGSENDDEIAAFYSLENRVDSTTPPTFIWHTVNDGTVPVENTLLFMLQLQRNKVEFEGHVFDKGPHGLALANYTTNHINPHCEHWLDLSLEWLKRQFDVFGESAYQQ